MSMLPLKPKVRKRLKKLAKLRSEGKSWPAIEAETGWPAEASQRLVERHLGPWLSFLRRWLLYRSLEGLQEGVTVLRVLLRSQNEATRRGSAAALSGFLRLVIRPRRRPTPGLEREDEELLNYVRVLKTLGPKDMERMKAREERARLEDEQQAAANGGEPAPPQSEEPPAAST
jgi:hypothetical protein